MLDKVMTAIKKYNMLSKFDTVVIGVSGGADSVCLTDVLNSIKDEYSLNIILVHINHNIRGAEAKRDQAFVENLGKIYGNTVKVFSYPVEEMARKKGLTTEEMGRKLRYDAFYSVAGDNGKIAVAHNMNDNAETMLMRFFRGTGIKGLGGISASRDRIIRPLIRVERREIEQYCGEKGLEYCTDSTNNIAEYTRNKIRLNVIPFVQRELNAGIVETMWRTSELMAEENRFIEKMADRAYADCCVDSNRIDIDRLLTYDIVMQRRVVRKGFVSFSADLHDISFDHVERVLSLCAKESGKTVELPNGLRATKEHNTLYFSKYKEDKSFCYKIELNQSYEFSDLGVGILISANKIDEFSRKIYYFPINCDKIKGELLLRSRQSGDRITLSGGTKTIKKLFIDEKVPLSKRDSIPLLAVANEIVWIKDMKTSAYFKAESDENAFYIYLWEVNK